MVPDALMLVGDWLRRKGMLMVVLVLRLTGDLYMIIPEKEGKNNPRIRRMPKRSAPKATLFFTHTTISILGTLLFKYFSLFLVIKSIV